MVAGKAPYDTWNPATAEPVVGTDICGFPREGVVLSFTCSHVQMAGWRLKSVNHSHAVSVRGRTRTATRSLAFTPNLHCAMLLEQIFGGPSVLGSAFYPHTVVA